MAGKPDQGGQRSAEGSEAARSGRVEAAAKQIWQAFQMQRREDKMLLPLMIGAIVLARRAGLRHRAALRHGVVLLPLGIALGAARRRVDLRPPGPEDRLPQGRGPAGRRGLGAGQHARLVAGHPGRRGHHPPRRRAPGDRPARRHPGRRGGPAPGEDPARAGEEAHRAGGRARRRSTTSSSATTRARCRCASSSAPDEAAAQHLDRPDGRRSRSASRRWAARGRAMPKGPLPAGAKMRSIQRTVRRR